MTAVRYWTLVGHTPVPADDVLAWGRWFAQADDERQVGLAHLLTTTVSTVFVGLGLSWRLSDDEPMLFETLVRDDALGWDIQDRYATWDEAEAGHQAWVWRVVWAHAHDGTPEEAPEER